MVVYRIGPCVHWSFELYMLALVAAIVGNSLSFYTAFFFYYNYIFIYIILKEYAWKPCSTDTVCLLLNMCGTLKWKGTITIDCGEPGLF